MRPPQDMEKNRRKHETYTNTIEYIIVIYPPRKVKSNFIIFLYFTFPTTPNKKAEPKLLIGQEWVFVFLFAKK